MLPLSRGGAEMGKIGEIVRDVSPESLARANEDNLAEGLAARAPMGATCAMGLHAAGWNRVPRAQLAPETVDERVAWVIARARALGVPFLWDIGPSMRPLDLGGHLLRHGFSDEGEEPAMGVALANLPETLPLHDGVTIERVSDRAAQEQWVRTSCEGFGMPPSAVEPEVAAMAHDSLGDDAAAHYYLARLHGEPVATSALTLAAGVAGIFAVSTLEAARGRGIGTAVTLAPLLDARSRGYCVVVLQASEMGYPVYARMGFSEQFRYRMYRWAPERGE